MSPNFFSQIFMKITTYPNFNVENLKTENIFPYFFLFIFIFASISQKYPKKWVKTFSNRFSWKLPHDLILIWIIQKSNSFSQIFSSSSSFLPWLVKNGLKKKWVKNFFLRFSWKFLYNLISIWRIQEVNSFFQIFLWSSSFLSWLVKNVLSQKNFSKIFMKTTK